MAGSGFYQAPEIGHSDTYTNKVDMWALGVMFYRMLFGDYPYSPMKIHSWVFDVNETPEEPEISNDSCEILERLLVNDPN